MVKYWFTYVLVQTLLDVITLFATTQITCRFCVEIYLKCSYLFIGFVIVLDGNTFIVIAMDHLRGNRIPSAHHNGHLPVSNIQPVTSRGYQFQSNRTTFQAQSRIIQLQGVPFISARMTAYCRVPERILCSYYCLLKCEKWLNS